MQSHHLAEEEGKIIWNIFDTLLDKGKHKLNSDFKTELKNIAKKTTTFFIFCFI